MKTLVIHPKDRTTDVLSGIYEGTDWTIINYRMPQKDLKEQIVSHERIIMLGHGSPDGLFGYSQLVINWTFAPLFSGKKVVCIWCHANEFVLNNNISAICSGMIISEPEEAYLYSISPIRMSDITHSNELFTQAVKACINDTLNPEELYKQLYVGENNPIIDFNKTNFFDYRESLHQVKIKKECEMLYLEIKMAEQRLKEIRATCEHPQTFEGDYMWRVGSIIKATLCSDCGQVVKDKSKEESNNNSKDLWYQ